MDLRLKHKIINGIRHKNIIICKKNHNNTRSNKTIHYGKIINNVFVVLILLWGIITVSQRTIGNIKIRNDRRETVGIVYAEGNISTIRQKKIKYYNFFINGDKYEGSSSYDEDLNVGDSIRVVYYPKDPNINRSWRLY